MAKSVPKKSAPPAASQVSALALLLLLLLSLLLFSFSGRDNTSIGAVILNPKIVVSFYNATTYSLTSMPPPPPPPHHDSAADADEEESSRGAVAFSAHPPPEGNGDAVFSVPLQPAENGEGSRPDVAASMLSPPEGKNKNRANDAVEGSGGGAFSAPPPAKNKKPINATVSVPPADRNKKPTNSTVSVPPAAKNKKPTNSTVSVPPAAKNDDSISAAVSVPAGENKKLISASTTSTRGLASRCDLFDGKWVVDESMTPSYAPGSCPFIESAFDCYGNGRRDLNYTRLRWQPKACTMPRFDGERMLEMLRGKRLAFVGDSLNRNMWESLVCMLRQSLRHKNSVFETSGRGGFKSANANAFEFTDYDCTIEYYRSTFLVQPWQRTDSRGAARETLRLDRIGKTTAKCRGADVVVFNTGHWWTHSKTSEGINYYQEGNHLHPKLSADDAYRKALTTWARWIDGEIDPNRTRVFFRGYSWTHFSGGQWDSGGNCDGETVPITDEKHLSRYYPVMNGIAESVLGKMRNPVDYLNVTRMTDYRKDGHPSVYYLRPEHQKKAGAFQDCSHWCLPGVPDAWNEILYAMLLQQRFRR